jgi:glutathione S-transferase
MQTRLIDRLIDGYIHLPLQRVVADRLRPHGQQDSFGVAQAKDQIRAGYSLLAPMIAGPWAAGESFTLADCAALPALFYADYAVPLVDWPELASYLSRLKARPSVARVLAEAEPFFKYFPLKDG